ncbi:MAG: DUF3078 domain-containing protein [Bacteroidales bacterium]
MGFQVSGQDNLLSFSSSTDIQPGYLITTDTPAPLPPPAWSYGGRSAINFSQMSLINWSAGGGNAYSLAGLIQLFGKYNKGKADWSNTLDLGYGVIRTVELGMRKSDDKVDFLSKFGYLAINRWHYSGMLNFKTQMDNGYLYEKDTDPKLISGLMSPGYLLGSLGMEYKSKNEAFYILISPITGKSTFVFNDSLSQAGAYGVEPGHNFRMEFGGYTKIAYSKEIMKNVNLSTKLDLFSNYLENPQNIDINMETILMMKVNKFLVTSITMNLIYDDDIMITDSNGNTGPRTQFKEVLAIGLSYSF